MHNTKDLKKRTQHLRVLYVEDDEDIRQEMLTLLELLFMEVITAADGQAGLEAFRDDPLDIVITDIQMPRMNGLEMVKKIKEFDSEIPVIVTTAYGDQSYFIEAINLGIDKYLLKPIEQERAKNTFHHVALAIEQREEAKALEAFKQEQALFEASEKMLKLITDSFPNPCIVCSEHATTYVNQAFLQTFGYMQESVDGCASLNTLFDLREGFLTHIEKYDFTDHSANKVSISMPRGRKIFQLIIKPVALNPQSAHSLITFNDITWSEYQKIKLRNYSEMLEEYIFTKQYKGRGSTVTMSEASVAPLQEKKGHTPSGPSDSTEETAAEEKLKLDKEQTDLLRRSHAHKTSAQDYIDELDDDTLLELQELDELDEELAESVADFAMRFDTSCLDKTAVHLRKYAYKIGLLFAFEDLCYAINALSQLLGNIDADTMDDKKLRKLSLLLSGIQSDLENWRRVIFIEQETQDIHYLDSSLFSTCLQIEMLLSNTSMDIETEDDDENDLILF